MNKQNNNQKNNQIWRDIARNLLSSVRSIKKKLHPEPIGAIITWKKDMYIGHIQEVISDSSKEIVILSKSSYPLQKELVEEIRKLDKERIELHADDILDLDGRLHVVRRLDNRLTFMTHDQTLYMMKNKPLIYEINNSYEM